ncbi:response regulator [endosymbiont of unidentified scaly snail isolate Monju]|uniref:response regulator n=1 Tax=endosymbiont of unidentified scaly snail isolate Monju TaxID=1248727 RepID=UPI00038920A1|nr:response regulator [endosymbiont of unidentified scaly snail isolate Monju]BAN69959.1 two-component system, OmpR family, phosphate regulon response regulator PhoB [endosymbiont of unidentified scaly snail isolate Monju]
MTTILFVEDEAPIRDMVRFALSRAGMEMLEAGSVAEAEHLLAVRRPDLVLLDWMLPERSGIALLRHIRQHEGLSDIPVILLTALAEEAQRVQGLEAGADDYVVKPFSPPELIARIRAVLRRDLDGRLRLGELVLDPATRQVECEGSPVPLGPTEFRLLRFLLQNPNRVYSRGQLLDRVWGDDVALEERTVDVSVRRLRKALAPFGLDGCIETVRGAGYRLVSAGA